MEDWWCVKKIEKLEKRVDKLEEQKEPCKYCAVGTIEGLSVRSNVRADYMALVAVTETGGREIVCQKNRDGVFGIKIRYCPMCGRKFEKDSWREER